MLPDAERVRELKKLYLEVVAAQNRGLRGGLAVVAFMVLIGSTAFRPAFALFAGMILIGSLVMVWRAVRRRRNVLAFCRDARLIDAQIIVPSSRPDHVGGWYQELAIPDPERAVVARVKRRWPRSSLVSEPTRAPTWYAPTSSIVISFDPRGEPTLGRIETRPLPPAALVQR